MGEGDGLTSLDMGSMTPRDLIRSKGVKSAKGKKKKGGRVTPKGGGGR
jgi:hypothetical protein